MSRRRMSYFDHHGLSRKQGRMGEARAEGRGEGGEISALESVAAETQALPGAACASA